jgi:hypothetical protein
MDSIRWNPKSGKIKSFTVLRKFRVQLKAVKGRFNRALQRLGFRTRFELDLQGNVCNNMNV